MVERVADVYRFSRTSRRFSACQPRETRPLANLDSGSGSDRRNPVTVPADHRALRSDAGFAVSLGPELPIEVAARDRRLSALVADGPTPDGRQEQWRAGRHRAAHRMAPASGRRGISGTRPCLSLIGLMPRIAPHPVLLVAGGRRPGRDPDQPRIPRRERPGDLTVGERGRPPRRRAQDASRGLRAPHGWLPRRRRRALSDVASVASRARARVGLGCDWSATPCKGPRWAGSMTRSRRANRPSRVAPKSSPFRGGWAPVR
jgi:hypothetical protein